MVARPEMPTPSTQIDHVAHDPKDCVLQIEGIPGALQRAGVLEIMTSHGNRYWDGGSDHRIATHRIAIPIVSEPSAEQTGRDFAETLAVHEGRSGISADGTQ